MGVKSVVEHVVKFNPVANSIFTGVASTAVKAMGIAEKTRSNRVLFTSDIGKNYTGSPRAIYERMLETGLADGYEIAWAFTSPEKYADLPCKVLKLDSPEYFRYAISAAYWVTDVNIERGLVFKRKGTRYLNTWHGSSFKTLGWDIHNRIYYDCSSIDYMCVSSRYDMDIFSKAFKMDEQKFIQTGLPRNDELHTNAAVDTAVYKRKLGYPKDKKLILYAPTWRDTTDGGQSYSIAPPINLTKWKERLSQDFILAFRMHPITQKAIGIVEDDFCKDVSSYQPLNDLLLAADLLITDYSSIAIDYAIMGRPVLCFGYDLKEYERARGLNLNLAETFPMGIQSSEDELIDLIKSDEVWQMPQSTAYAEFRAFNEFGGNATDACIEKLFGI